MTTRAFSLVEVMVSATLFLASAAGVVSAVSTASGLYEHQRRLTQAASIGEFKMEELLLRYTSHVDISPTGSTPRFICVTPSMATVPCTASATSATTMQVPPTIGPNYLVYWSVRDAPVTGLRQLDLVVAWREAVGQRELPLMTYRR